MALWLVTGGAGFIGSHLVRALLSRGEHVRVLDNFSTGSAERLASASGVALDVVEDAVLTNGAPRALSATLELVVGDTRDTVACAVACAGVDVVSHQAAQRSVPRSMEDPEGAHDVNATGTLRMLRAAKAAGVGRFIYASSSSVYGDNPALPKREDQVPAPVSPYAVSKLAGEHYCRVFARAYGLPTTSLRYFNVFGPGQDPNSEYAAVIPKFIAAALAGRPLEIHGDGEQSRDFTYVDNVVHANILAAVRAPGEGETVNVGCGQHHTLKVVADLLSALMQQPVHRVYCAPRAGDIRHSHADISRAAQLIGYAPPVLFDKGLQRTMEGMAGSTRLVPAGGA